REVKPEVKEVVPESSPVTPEAEIKEPAVAAPSEVEAPKGREAAQEKVGEQLALKEKAAEREIKPEVKEAVPESGPMKAAAEIKEPAVAAPSAVEALKGPEAAQEKVAEQLALKKKVPLAPTEKQSVEKPLQPEILGGYIVQLLFSEELAADRWSSRLRREGYFTSITTIAGNQSVRLRVGNFALHAEAAKLLRRLRGRRLKGLVIHITPAKQLGAGELAPKNKLQGKTHAPSVVSRSRHLSPKRPVFQNRGPYIIQVSFSDGGEAKRWSDRAIGDGYSTSMSTLEGDAAVRLRVGDFSSAADAENFLTRLRSEGLKGLVAQVVSKN
ncbi:MAG: SPOR domain-containing protein, partial [Candidatus Binatia bacterium]